jgi:hypothetical protein
MRDPKNLEAVAKSAAPTSRSIDDAKWSIQAYLQMGFWPSNHGLDRKGIEAVLAAQKRVGNIKEQPTTYDKLVDLSLYEEAVKRVK